MTLLPFSDHPAKLTLLLDQFSGSGPVQQGPFLRVVDVGDDCLSITVRAELSHDSEELACVAEQVLLQDQGDVVVNDGVIWRSVRTPVGIEGWADARYLGE